MAQRMPYVFALILGISLAAAGRTAAQGNPTGTVSGHVVDQAGLAVPGATVTASSPALQGVRTATTSENGDYIIPFLPAGDYEVKFELQGFKTTTRPVSVKMAETLPLNVTLAIAAVAESVTVTGASPDIVPTATIAANFKKEALERLPVGRALNDAVLLAPGVAGNGPSGNIMMAGALSFESQYLVNGVVINENLRGQALNLFIEDAIQETKVSTGAISAEYGRFGGGVVNMITKSGGNRFSGSFRTTFDNDAWRSLTPFPSDQTVDAVTPTYEMTAGGPVVKDKLWYSARDASRSRSAVSPSPSPEATTRRAPTNAATKAKSRTRSTRRTTRKSGTRSARPTSRTTGSAPSWTPRASTTTRRISTCTPPITRACSPAICSSKASTPKRSRRQWTSARGLRIW